MSILQAASARFTGGKTPGVAFPANTQAGSDLLGIAVFSNNNSSNMTTGLTSQNPGNQSWGSPLISTAFAGTGGLTLKIWRIPTAQARVAHDVSSGATFQEVMTLDVGTFSTLFVIEQDADIEGIDVFGFNTGTGTTIPAMVGTNQYGDYVLAVLAHRNTDDQTLTNLSSSWLPGVQGAGNPSPIGAAANTNAVSVGIAVLPTSAVNTYTLGSSIGTSRNYVFGIIAFKSFSGSRPPYGTIGATSLWGASAAPTLSGGNTQALVGVSRSYRWPALLTGAEQIAPTVANLASTNVTQTTADVSFDVNPGGLQTSLLIDYTSALDGSGNPDWTLASHATPTASPLAASESPTTVTQTLTSLSAATTYYWRVEATNNQGTIISDQAVFATLAIPVAPPVPVAINATSVSDTAATLVGSVNPENLDTHYYFEWGTSSSLATFTSTADTDLGVIDQSAHTVSAVLSGLTGSTTYYFRVHAYNALAPEAAGGVDSSIVSFTTAAPAVGAPIPTTGTPSTTKATSLVVPGTVDPNGGATTWKAQASTNGFVSVAAETTAVALPDPTAGNVQNVSGTITGLNPSTAYTTRITATNSNSTVNAAASGSISTEALPTLTSPASSAVTATSATLSVNVGHSSMTPGVTWAIVYGPTSSYGTTVSSGTVAAGDPNPSTVSGALTGLTPSTTYHWRAQATRADGDGTLVVTADQMFTTSAAPSLITVVTPSAYGPATPISTSTSSGVPAYTIQVKADGTLIRSDTSAAITIAGNLFTGSGTVIIASDAPGTQRTPAAGVFDQVIFQGPKVIWREIIGTTAMGTFESNNSAAGVDFAMEFQGCSGTWKHTRAVACSGAAIRLTKSPAGLLCGSQGASWPSWVWGGQTPGMILDNATGQCITASTGCALQVDGARNVQIGGFDAGSQSTISAVAAPLAQHAVRMDAALRSGGVKTDVQDVYITTATDTTPSMLSSKTGTYTTRWGTLKRSGILAATFLNTLHQRPEKPIWFELSNGTQPGSETSGNCTNDQVIAEHFVLRNALSQNLVTATFRDGATKDQQLEVRCDVYDPAVALTLWTPHNTMDTWPNGANRFICVNGVKRSLGPRPTTAAWMPPPAPQPPAAVTPLANKSIFDETWTHMGGVTGDGVTEIVGVLIDPDLMADGAGSGGVRYQTNQASAIQNNKPAAPLTVKTAVSVSQTTPTTVVVQAPGGGAPDFTNWDNGSSTQKAVTSISNATPPVVTATGHGYSTNDVVAISGSSVAAYNNEWTITKITADTFSLNGGTASGAATGGNAIRRMDLYGILTGYADANLGPNAVATGVPYRRSLSYTGIDTVAGAFTGVKLVPGPSGTGPTIGSAGGLPTIGGDILKIASGVVESFYPHGLPTGDQVTIASVPGLGAGPYTVTRVDNYHFSLNGQGAFSWTPTLGTVGTYTPTTPHAYGLTGAETGPITLAVNTTIDSTQNLNHGQAVSNVVLHLKAGSRVRFVRCTINDVSFVCDSPASRPEFVDCDGSVAQIPGSYDYDSPSTLGVCGTYDRFSVPLLGRTVIANNLFGGSDALWSTIRMVHTGAHGDVFPGRFATGSNHDECYIDQSSPAGTNNETEANTRPGIGSNLPRVSHSTHGDICQWFARVTAGFTKSALGGMAHSVYFGTLGSYETHTGCTLSNSGGAYKVTMTSKHNFDSSGFDTVIIQNAGPLNGEYLVTVVDSKNIILQGSVYPAVGAQTTADTVHSQHMSIPGCYRSSLTTVKHVNYSDRTRLSPVLSKGNLTAGIGIKGSLSPLLGPPPSNTPLVVPGTLDYTIKFWDCCIDNGGAFNVPDPQGNTSWIDLGSPNRNAFTTYSGTGIPGATATLHYT